MKVRANKQNWWALGLLRVPAAAAIVKTDLGFALGLAALSGDGSREEAGAVARVAPAVLCAKDSRWVS